MTADKLRDMLVASPFRKFHVKTTDGDTFTVEHSDYALISPGETDVVIYDRDDHFRHVSIDHIVTLEQLRETARRTGKR